MQFQLMALDDNANCRLNTDKCAAGRERERDREKSERGQEIFANGK